MENLGRKRFSESFVAIKHELQNFAKSVAVFSTPLFTVAVLIVTNATKRQCTLADILAANEDSVSVSDAVDFLLEFRRVTKHPETILLLDCLLGSLSFWRRLELKIQKLCYLLNLTHADYAYFLATVFIIDTLKHQTDVVFTPRAEHAQAVSAAASAIVSLLAKSSAGSSECHSRLDELNMRLAFLEWLSKNYNLSEKDAIIEKLPIQMLRTKIETYAGKIHAVRRGTSASTALIPWSPLEVGHISEPLLDDIDELARWPIFVEELKQTAEFSRSPLNPMKRQALEGEALNEAEIDRDRHKSRVFLKRTNTVVPDSPYKQRKLQRFASGPLNEAESLQTPPRPPAKRARKPMLQLHTATQFSFETCVFPGISGEWSLAGLRAELERLGLVSAVNPIDLGIIDELITCCVTELSSNGGPLQMDAHRSEKFLNLARLLLALSAEGPSWPLALTDAAVVQGICILTAQLMHAEKLLEVEPTFAGVPQYPTVLSASRYSGFTFGSLAVWLGLDWLLLYAVLETVVDPAVKAIVAACGDGITTSTTPCVTHLDHVKEELLRLFVFREESGLWSAIANLRRLTLKENLILKLGATVVEREPEVSEVAENTFHVLFTLSCVKLLDVTSRCALGAKTAAVLHLTVDLLRATLLWKTHLFRNRDAYEILACCLLAASRLFRTQLSWSDLREAFAVAGRGRKLGLSFSNVAATSDSLHSEMLTWEKALERGMEGKLQATLLDEAYMTLELTEFYQTVFMSEMEVFLSQALKVIDNKTSSSGLLMATEPAKTCEFMSPDASPFAERFFGELLRNLLKKVDRKKDEYSLEDWRRALRLSSPLGYIDCLFPVLSSPGRSQGGFAWIPGILVKEVGDGIQVIPS